MIFNLQLTGTNPLDTLTTFVTVMIALSVATERVTETIKQWASPASGKNGRRWCHRYDPIPCGAERHVCFGAQWAKSHQHSRRFCVRLDKGSRLAQLCSYWDFGFGRVGNLESLARHSESGQGSKRGGSKRCSTSNCRKDCPVIPHHRQIVQFPLEAPMSSV